MNRRGELERAISVARLRASDYGLFTQLLRRSGNDTGEVDDDKWTPKLTTLAAQAKLSRSAGYVALAHLIQHGWVKRYETDDRGKVAALLMMGQDCDCGDRPEVACKVCGRPLASSHRHALYCSPGCRTAAWRLRKQASPVQESVTAPIQETVTAEPEPSPGKRHAVTDKSVTPVQPSRHRSQVSPAVDIEIRDREQGKEIRPAQDDGISTAVRELAAASMVTGADLRMVPGSRRPVPVCGWCGGPPGRCGCFGSAGGPCARCRIRCRRYEAGGNPLCDSCRAVLYATDEENRP